jgi:thiamine biosynthesis lipoprotein
LLSALFYAHSMPIEKQRTELIRRPDCWLGQFRAMASPCEVLMDVEDKALAAAILQQVSTEAFRIEHKFSRYREDNIIYRINHANGEPVSIDDETARLLDFADELFRLSDGLFDVTSGVLRRAWTFDGSDRLPAAESVATLLDIIGWQKVSWQRPRLTLLKDMEIDLGGIGKEYAVDRCVQIARKLADKSVLVNFGGDLAVTVPRDNNGFWSVGRLITGKENAVSLFELRRGAIATSGDAHRYLLKDGVRYSHVLNPKTGWPVPDAPHTVSVAAPTCVEAGMMSTLAMLQGADARAFLEAQEINFWVD